MEHTPPPSPPPEVIEKTCLFAPGSARLDDQCKKGLDWLALQMKGEPDAQALVIGFGDAAGNEALGEGRARAVKEYVVTRHGIDPSRITTEGRDEGETGRAVMRVTLP